MKRDDFYTSDFRAGIQRSMAEPAKNSGRCHIPGCRQVPCYDDAAWHMQVTKEFKPLNRRESKSYIPLPRVERRRRHLARFWFNYHRDIGRFLWSLVFVFVAAEVILIYGIR